MVGLSLSREVVTSISFQAGLLILCIVLQVPSLTRLNEVSTTALGWALIFAHSLFGDRSTEKTGITAPWVKWSVCGTLAIAAEAHNACSDERIWFLVFVIVLIYEHRTTITTGESKPTLSIQSWLLLLGSVLGALWTAFLLTYQCTTQDFVIGSISILAIIAALVALSLTSTNSWIRVDLETQSIEKSVAWRSAALLFALVLLEVFAVKASIPDIRIVLWNGLLKAVQWHLLISISRTTCWGVIPPIAALSGSGLEYPTPLSLFRFDIVSTLLNCLALWQTIRLIPKNERLRKLLWAFLIVVPISNQLKSATSSTKDTQHPIQSLAHEAEIQFSKKFSRQSNTYDAAYAEYKRRYSRDPPQGFHDWFDYAKAHNSCVIDDYDNIDQYLAPLRGVDVTELVERMRRALEADGSIVQLCGFEDGERTSGCELFGPELLEIISGFQARLPKVQLLINQLDEPRVLLDSSDHTLAEDKSVPFTWTDLSGKNTWDEAIRYCSARGHSPAQSTQPHDLALVQDVHASNDICQNADYQSMHAFFISPATFSFTHSAVPILSAAVISTMADIPSPASAYTNSYYAYKESEDLDWDKKIAGLYWTGGTTGGFQTNASNWKNFHRQRFVAATNNTRLKPNLYLHRGVDERWQPEILEDWNFESYDVHFTNIVQCEGSICDDISNEFKILPPESRNEAAKYTLNFDLDGNGMSGRFYRLMQSRSLVLKQTVFREWHDERLLPWLHYIPVSIGMQELPEVVRYFVEEEEGRALAQDLAEKGREWSNSVLRPVDQAIYLYRLFLELARLQNPSEEGTDVS